ncbi:MAG: GGDEF domain-containing protein [Burkholderiales bacterium]|nr:GGDEF domain-containing protein [Burkholderiales bacterium]
MTMQINSDDKTTPMPQGESGAAVAASGPTGGGASAKLLRLFATLSVIAVVSILALAGYGIYHVYSSEMIKMAEATAVHVGESIFEQERARLLQWGGESTVIAVRPEEFAQLDLRMRKFLRTFDMHKIKVFSADKTIVYSTDAQIIGKVEADNPKLDEALADGAVVSQLEYKDTLRDLKGEDRFRVDMVETYVPVRADNFVVGAFEVYTDVSSVRNRVSDALAYTLAVLAVVLIAVFALLYLPMRAGMVQLRKAEDRLRELASVDGLTGIFNRRHVLERVGKERERMRRVHEGTAMTSMALLMVDIDHFKRVNDTHGHQAGDEVLRATSSRLTAALRPYDFIGRYGGEEFLVVLPQTRLAEALKVAERVRACVFEPPVRCGKLELQVSVSIGVATPVDADETNEQILNRADQGLYQAKENGRNRVCSVQSLETDPV